MNESFDDVVELLVWWRVKKKYVSKSNHVFSSMKENMKV